MNPKRALSPASPPLGRPLAGKRPVASRWGLNLLGALAVLPAASLSAAQAAPAQPDLRVYPTFAEVLRPLSPAGKGASALNTTFSRSEWAWVVPGSVRLPGTPLRRLQVLPADPLRAEVGQPVRVLRGGQSLSGTLVNAEGLVQLGGGGYVTARPEELVLTRAPGDGVRLVLEPAAQAGGALQTGATLLYQTFALSWQPRYELDASGDRARLEALAELRNRGPGRYAGRAELYAGDVSGPALARAVTPAAVEAQTGNASTTSGAGRLGADNAAILSLGETRGLQRYVLGQPLNLAPQETQTLPFLTPQLSGFTRYARISSYFSGQNASGRATRFYKFTASTALPAGPLTVREDGVLVGSVALPSTPAGQLSDLSLGSDPELRYQRVATLLGTEKATNGRILSRRYRLDYTLTSTKSAPITTQLREQFYGQSVTVDGQVLPTPGTLTRYLKVPAGGKATLSITVKISGG